MFQEVVGTAIHSSLIIVTIWIEEPLFLLKYGYAIPGERIHYCLIFLMVYRSRHVSLTMSRIRFYSLEPVKCSWLKYRTRCDVKGQGFSNLARPAPQLLCGAHAIVPRLSPTCVLHLCWKLYLRRQTPFCSTCHHHTGLLVSK